MSDLREYVKGRLARYPGVDCALHYDLRHWLMEHPPRPHALARAKAEALREAADEWVYLGGQKSGAALLRARADRIEPTDAACNRGPCHLPLGHEGRCNPGGDAITDEGGADRG